MTMSTTLIRDRNIMMMTIPLMGEAEHHDDVHTIDVREEHYDDDHTIYVREDHYDDVHMINGK